MVQEAIIDTYGPLEEIRTTHRFAAYEGHLNGEKVFIKKVIDPELRERLLSEAMGLVTMREIDPLGTHYRVPGVIELTSNYIVTEWASGIPMEEDFLQGRDQAIQAHLPYLVSLYAFIDERSNGGRGVTRFNRPGREPGVAKALAALEKLDFRQHIDGKLIEYMATFITRTIPETSTRFTNGDLQPGNVLIDGEGVPTVIDCETCSWLWPRHYNIVNFMLNYGAKYPSLAPAMQTMFREYCERVGVEPSRSVDAFNVSAAARCLQIVQEQLTVHEGEADAKSLDPEVRSYVEMTMKRIASNELFVDL